MQIEIDNIEKRSIFSVIWKIGVSLITASVPTTLVLIPGMMLSHILMQGFMEREGYYDFPFSLVLYTCVFISILFTPLITLFEILARRFNWQRGIGEPMICSLICLGITFLYARQEYTVGLGFYASPSDEFNYFYLLCGALSGAIGGYVYYWMNRKLDNL